MSNVQCIWDAKAELGEGALWHEAEQALYWVDIIRSQLHRYRTDSHGHDIKDTWDFPGNLSSVVPCREGGLLATFTDGVSHIDLETCTVTQLQALETELPHNRFNDGCCDTRGNFWFGSMDNNERDANGSFYRLLSQEKNTQEKNSHNKNAPRTVDHLTQLGEICITNGPTFSADGQWLYFTDTLERKIFRTALSDDGSIGAAQLHIQIPEGEGYPDGMCTDSEGYLWVCHFAGARVTRFAPNGTAERVIRMPVPNITKCAFGGPTLNTLYITTAAKGMSAEERAQAPLAGGLFAVELEQQGFTFPANSIKS